MLGSPPAQVCTLLYYLHGDSRPSAELRTGEDQSWNTNSAGWWRSARRAAGQTPTPRSASMRRTTMAIGWAPAQDAGASSALNSATPKNPAPSSRSWSPVRDDTPGINETRRLNGRLLLHGATGRWRVQPQGIFAKRRASASCADRGNTLPARSAVRAASSVFSCSPRASMRPAHASSRISRDLAMASR